MSESADIIIEDQNGNWWHNIIYSYQDPVMCGRSLHKALVDLGKDQFIDFIKYHISGFDKFELNKNNFSATCMCHLGALDRSNIHGGFAIQANIAASTELSEINKEDIDLLLNNINSLSTRNYAYIIRNKPLGIIIQDCAHQKHKFLPIENNRSLKKKHMDDFDIDDNLNDIPPPPKLLSNQGVYDFEDDNIPSPPITSINFEDNDLNDIPPPPQKILKNNEDIVEVDDICVTPLVVEPDLNNKDNAIEDITIVENKEEIVFIEDTLIQEDILDIEDTSNKIIETNKEPIQDITDSDNDETRLDNIIKAHTGLFRISEDNSVFEQLIETDTQETYQDIHSTILENNEDSFNYVEAYTEEIESNYELQEDRELPDTLSLDNSDQLTNKNSLDIIVTNNPLDLSIENNKQDIENNENINQTSLPINTALLSTEALAKKIQELEARIIELENKNKAKTPRKKERCGEIMPRANTVCGAPAGHDGPHRRQ